MIALIFWQTLAALRYACLSLETTLSSTMMIIVAIVMKPCTNTQSYLKKQLREVEAGNIWTYELGTLKLLSCFVPMDFVDTYTASIYVLDYKKWNK